MTNKPHENILDCQPRVAPTSAPRARRLLHAGRPSAWPNHRWADCGIRTILLAALAMLSFAGCRSAPKPAARHPHSVWVRLNAGLAEPTTNLWRKSEDSVRIRCVDFATSPDWLRGYPDLASKSTPWGRHFAAYLAEALRGAERDAYTARHSDEASRASAPRSPELVCLGELLAVQPNPGGTNASQHQLRLEYELKSTRQLPASLLEKRELSVTGEFTGELNESHLHQLLRLGADRVADNVKRKLPSAISGVR